MREEATLPLDAPSVLPFARQHLADFDPALPMPLSDVDWDTVNDNIGAAFSQFSFVEADEHQVANHRTAIHRAVTHSAPNDSAATNRTTTEMW